MLNDVFTPACLDEHSHMKAKYDKYRFLQKFLAIGILHRNWILMSQSHYRLLGKSCFLWKEDKSVPGRTTRVEVNRRHKSVMNNLTPELAKDLRKK